jgi:hypothetical protein
MHAHRNDPVTMKEDAAAWAEKIADCEAHRWRARALTAEAQLAAVERERDEARKTLRNQLQVTVTARQAVSDVVAQRNAARAEIERLRQELIRVSTLSGISALVITTDPLPVSKFGGQVRLYLDDLEAWAGRQRARGLARPVAEAIAQP